MTIQVKVIERYIPVVLFIMLYKVALLFLSVSEIHRFLTDAFTSSPSLSHLSFLARRTTHSPSRILVCQKEGWYGLQPRSLLHLYKIKNEFKIDTLGHAWRVPQLSLGKCSNPLGG